MIPWQKLPKDLQRTVLAIVVLSGEAAAASSCRPMVCDPAPPPRTTPTPTMTPASPLTPMICDPAPPPTITRTPTMTPMICDPAPPPTLHAHANDDADDLRSATAAQREAHDDAHDLRSAAAARPGSQAEADRPRLLCRASRPAASRSSPIGCRRESRSGAPWRIAWETLCREARITLAAPGIEITSRTNDSGTYSLHFNAQAPTGCLSAWIRATACRWI